MTPRLSEAELLQAFRSRVAVAPNGCWLWQGEKVAGGYGRLWVAGRHVLAHRWSYERFVGAIPAGKQLDHFVCDTPACCNPQHVRPATQRQNWERSRAPSAVAHRTGRCSKGHPMTGHNVYVPPSGGRYCRECGNQRNREYRRRKLSKEQG